jgi:thiol-disulfide isomerase/thioredoxin
MAAQGRNLLQISATMLMFGVGVCLPLLGLGLLSRETIVRWRGRLGSIGDRRRADRTDCGPSRNSASMRLPKTGCRYPSGRLRPRVPRIAVTRWLYLFVLAAIALSPRMSAAEDRLLLRGYSSQFIYLRPLEVVGPVQFLDSAGQPVDFGRFRGKVVLANLWATWCAPCVREMPELDRLQSKLGGDRLAVVAIALDTAGLEAVEPFFRRLGLAHLAIYLDPSHRTVSSGSRNLKPAPFTLSALPISYVIDDRGRAVGYLKGAADWTSPEARQFLNHFIAEAASGSK